MAARTVPVAAVLGAAAYLAWADRGSIAASDFLPLAVLLALLLCAVLASATGRRLAAAARTGAGALLALAVWAALSGLWAPLPSLARDEALLVGLGLVALLVPLLTLRGPLDRLGGLGVFVGVLGLLAVATNLHLLSSDAPADVFRDRRLSFPITYANASAGLFLAGLWPAILLAGRRVTSPFVRIPALGTATLLLATAFLAQSKGGIVGIVVSLVAICSLAPSRLRLLAALILAALPVAFVFGRLTAPYRSNDVATVTAVHGAATAALLAGVIGCVIGAGYVAADRRLRLDDRRRALVGRASAALAVLLLVATVGGFLVRVDSPSTWFGDHWRSFKHAPSPTTSGTTHLVELGSNRYDFWRVAIGEFKRHPLAGDGARGFGPAYLVRGRSLETPARAHSLPLELAGEEGIVGVLLAALGYGALLVGLGRRARRRSAAATAAFGGCTLLLGQALVDWTFTFPALTVPFFCLAGIGLADDARASLGPRLRRAGVVASLLVALLLFAPPWLSAKLVRRGLAERSASDLRWAHRLDPLSIDPLIAEAQIATTTSSALPPLEQARDRAPKSLVVHYLLGSVLYNAGRIPAARREFRTALRLHPGDAAVSAALKVLNARS